MKLKIPGFTTKTEKKEVCPFHQTTPVVEHGVAERQEYEYKYSPGKGTTKIALPRKITKGKHCPICFCNGPFVTQKFAMVEANKINGRKTVSAKGV